MVSTSLAGAVAAFAIVLLAAAVTVAGGWRRPSASVPAPQEVELPEVAVPCSIPAPLRALGWRLRLIMDAFRAAVLCVLGLSPLGAGLVRLVAPADTRWRVAVVMLATVAVPWGLRRLLARWWLRKVRASCPALVRPPLPWLRRLLGTARSALWLAGMLSAAAVLGGYHRVTMSVVELACFGMVVVLRKAVGSPSGDRLPPARLVTAMESLRMPPGARPVRVISGWHSSLANAFAVGSLARPRIVIAPPIADALTDAQLSAVLAHELAHVRNHDVLVRWLRRLLTILASCATALTLYGIPALRHVSGVHGAQLTGQSLPFLLAAAYLVFKVLQAMNLRAYRAEEVTADRLAVELTGDVQACRESLSALGSMLGTPASWTMAQRLLTATHPATTERLRLLGDAGATPGRARTAVEGYRPAVAVLTVIAIVAGAVLLDKAAVAGPPVNAGWYRVLPPSRFDGGTRTSALSPAWSDGIRRFSGGVPVAATYVKDGQARLYIWGAEGYLADPAGELAAFWKATDPLMALAVPGVSLQADAEPAGPLGGWLQCDPGQYRCAWADYSGIVVLSLSPPGDPGMVVSSPSGAADGPPGEQELAVLTGSFRVAAEHLRPPADRGPARLRAPSAEHVFSR